MSKYNGILIRANLDDDGSLPRQGVWTESPDIIPYGIKTVEDPVTFFTDNFDLYVSQDAILQNTNNFLYIRGKQYDATSGSSLDKSEARLYYAPAAVVLYPLAWLGNQLATTGGVKVVPVYTKKDNVFVTQDAFIWSPDATGHCCFVSFISTPGLNPFENQKPADSYTSVQEIGAWIQQTGGAGWHNVNVVSEGAAAFTHALPPYNSGAEDAYVSIGLRCKNIPIGSEVSFSSSELIPSGIDAGKTISVGKTSITSSDQTLAVNLHIPANFIANISYSYWPNGTTPDPSPMEFSLCIIPINTGTERDILIKKWGASLGKLLSGAQFYNHEKEIYEELSDEDAAKEAFTAGSYTSKVIIKTEK